MNRAAVDAVRAYSAAFAEKNERAPRVSVRTFGCQQNEADSERIAGMAVLMGYEYTENPEEAELIVFNTCAVREHAELKALSLTGQLKHLKAKNPALVTCVCGCMVAEEHRLNELKNKYPYIDILFGTGAHERFPEYLAAALKTKKRAFYPDPETMEISEDMPVRRENPRQAWVSIMYGCNNFCTYCVVPYVRGRERSRRPEDILNEIRELVKAGYLEITLLGQNVNSYGKGCDFGNGMGTYDFADLLSDICKIEGDYWIRFMTSHPKDASDRLFDVIAAHSGEDSRPHFCRQFHLPVQAGSDRILHKMNRHYERADYLALVERLRARVPEIALSTDVIVGFPTETEEEFDETLSLLRAVRYDAFFSFIYSRRKGTPADKMEQVPEEIKKARFARLLETQNEISLEKNRAFVGRKMRVLVEGVSKTDESRLTGRNEHNRLVHFPCDDRSLIGSFRTVLITGADTYTLSGEYLPEDGTTLKGENR